MIDIDLLGPPLVTLLGLLLPLLLMESVYLHPKVSRILDQRSNTRWLLLIVNGLGVASLFPSRQFQIHVGLLVVLSALYMAISVVRVAQIPNRPGRWISRYATALSIGLVIILWLMERGNWQMIQAFWDKCQRDLRVYMIVIAYIWVTIPCASIVKFIVGKLGYPKAAGADAEPKWDDSGIVQAGFYIGIFERLIILTLVLLKEYSAIGFLITGKSLLRMNSKGQTEYVLAGTLLSYALAILAGAFINWQFGL